ncbi:hypothetical protein L9F63_021781, partial [Diploptera punctata]
NFLLHKAIHTSRYSCFSFMFRNIFCKYLPITAIFSVQLLQFHEKNMLTVLAIVHDKLMSYPERFLGKKYVNSSR